MSETAPTKTEKLEKTHTHVAARSNSGVQNKNPGGLTVSMTTEGSHPVRSLGSRPLKIPKYQRTHWEGLPVGEQARVLRPALEVEAEQGVGRCGKTDQ